MTPLVDRRRVDSVPPPAEAVDETRVLVFAPRGRDAALTVELLASSRIAATMCSTIDDLGEKMREGAGTALLSEDALDQYALVRLAGALAAQPPWSDFPLIIVGGESVAGTIGQSEILAPLGNVTFLERPLRVRSMITAVQAALRARSRQYEARAAIRSRDEFLAMLGHELRNPLAAIRMAVDLIGRSESEAALERQRVVIDRQANHLAKLVDDLLDVARLTHGKVKLRRVSLDLGEVLHAVVQAYEHVAKANSVAVKLAVPSGLITEGDRVRLEQIFGNLVANALKYTPAGGVIDISASRMGEEIGVRVVDSGIGIEPALLPQIFELFMQAEQGISRSEGGMGLGLTLVKNLVQLHGGTVRADSKGTGLGSEFFVSLPCSNEPAPSEHDIASALSDSRLVVLVDDSDDLREMIEQALTMEGHRVTSAASGPSGVECIVASRPDIAFVDIGLPGFDGYEVARQVRSMLGEKVVLVAMSGYGQRDDRARAYDAGFNRHLTKPVGIREMQKVMGECIGAPQG